MIEHVHKYRFLLLCILLAIVTLAVYLSVGNHEFVRYDDDVYVTHNTSVKSGLSWQGIKWAFTTGYAANWHPLTWLSHQLDCQLFGLNSKAHHLINLLFHIANTVLLFIVLSQMTKHVWPSVFIAALFALHPLHVESVAWVAERKDVLSTFFWLLTMLAYSRYVRRPSAGRYVVTLMLFALGLLSKPMLVTLPIVLLLLDYWPLERFQKSKSSILHLIIEKIPFLLLSVISSVVTFTVQQKGGAMPSIYAIGLKGRIVNAISSYLAYITRMFWPGKLAALYPYPLVQIPTTKAVIYASIILLVTFFIIFYGRKHKYLITGWLWYVITLVPVIGIVQVGAQSMADRYTYVPLTGLFIIITFGANELTSKIPFRKFILLSAALISIIGCLLVTSEQLKHWRNSFSLFGHTLSVTKNNFVMLNNYANIVSEAGRPAEAVKYLAELLRFQPNSADARNNYANNLKKLGRLDEALEQYRLAVKLDPNLAMPHFNLALALYQKAYYDEAIKEYKTTIQLKPDFADAYSNLGGLLVTRGQAVEAIPYLEKALKFEPADIIAHGQLAISLAGVGRTDEAIEHCRIVLKVRPEDVEMQTNLGIMLQNRGQIEQAVEAYKKALQIDPNFTKAREHLDALTQKHTGK